MQCSTKGLNILYQTDSETKKTDKNIIGQTNTHRQRAKKKGREKRKKTRYEDDNIHENISHAEINTFYYPTNSYNKEYINMCQMCPQLTMPNFRSFLHTSICFIIDIAKLLFSISFLCPLDTLVQLGKVSDLHPNLDPT